MTIDNITPMPGKILVKKLQDETSTQSGIILTTPVNDDHLYIEVVKLGKPHYDDRLKVYVTEGDKCIIMGRSIYDSIEIDDDTYYFITQPDIICIVD